MYISAYQAIIRSYMKLLHEMFYVTPDDGLISRNVYMDFV